MTFPFNRLLSGFILWAATFLGLYATQATGCRLGWDRISLGPVSILRIGLIAILLACLALLFLASRHFQIAAKVEGGGDDEEVKRLKNIGAMMHLAAIGSVLITYAGVFWLRLC